MARRTDFNGQTKTITAATAQTLTWTSTELPSNRVIAYHVALSGTGNDLGAVSRIRLYANGASLINISGLFLRALWQTFSADKVTPAAADAFFTIPLLMLDQPTPETQDQSQFPVESQVQLDIETDATVGAGTAVAGWTETDVEAVVFPRILGSTMNIPASVEEQRFNYQENGVVRALGFPSAGVNRARLVVGGEVASFYTGPQYQGGTYGDMGQAMEQLYGGTKTLTDPTFHRVTLGKPAPSANSFVQLTTGAGWAGVANELVTVAVAPNGTAVSG